MSRFEMEGALTELRGRIGWAMRRYPQRWTSHEMGLSIVQEEVCELRVLVQQRESLRDPARMNDEAFDVAVAAARFVAERCSLALCDSDRVECAMSAVTHRLTSSLSAMSPSRSSHVHERFGRVFVAYRIFEDQVVREARHPSALDLIGEASLVAVMALRFALDAPHEKDAPK